MPAHDCRQTAPITALERRMDRSEAEYHQVLREIRDGQQSMVALLRDVATQSVRLNGQERAQEQLQKDVREAFGRIRTLELNPGARATKVYFIVLMAGASSVGGLVTGVALWLITIGA